MPLVAPGNQKKALIPLRWTVSQCSLPPPLLVQSRPSSLGGAFEKLGQQYPRRFGNTQFKTKTETISLNPKSRIRDSGLKDGQLGNDANSGSQHCDYGAL
jgi:hypothetical protein